MVAELFPQLPVAGKSVVVVHFPFDHVHRRLIFVNQHDFEFGLITKLRNMFQHFERILQHRSVIDDVHFVFDRRLVNFI